MNNDLQDLAERALQFSQELGCQYCDVRSENRVSKGFIIENGEIEHSVSKTEVGLGIRVLSKGAWGFYSISDPQNNEELKSGVKKAIQAANYQGQFAKNKIIFSDSKANKGNFLFPVKVEPTIDDLIKIGYECDKLFLKKNVFLSHKQVLVIKLFKNIL